MRLHDIPNEGIRAFGCCTEECNQECIAVCPAISNDRSESNKRTDTIKDLIPFCGPVLEIWESHASDDLIRFMGSSGGLITALSLFALEKGGMHGVLHTAGDLDSPWRNKTRLSRSRSELIAATGSRYAPASVCDRLDLVENAPAPCLIVGQPSEITAVRKAERLRPALAAKVGLTVSFFCAGSPSSQATLDLLRKLNVDPASVEEIRYRGRGWPGMFSTRLKGETNFTEHLTYSESWAFLQAYRPLSVHLMADGTGEDADITCGDPWYRSVQPGEPGTSLILIRTERGRRFFNNAVKNGVVVAKPLGVPEVIAAQKNLFAKRGAIWGRVSVMRLLGLPVPRLKGFHLFRNWLKLSLNEKLRSTFGTARRIYTKGWYKPQYKGEEGTGTLESEPLRVAQRP